MTFAFHHYSGMVLGILIARLFGCDPLILGILGFVIGGWPDTASWVLWKLTNASWWKWKRWARFEYYSWCHPIPEWGQHDKYGKWIPFWGQHTWLYDSIIHLSQRKFLFPQFNPIWKDIIWIRIWPTHWNIEWTKWDVLYVILEASLWILYTVFWLVL